MKGKSVEYFVWTTKYAENQAVQVARHAEKTTENMVALTTVKAPSSKMNLVQMQGANTSIVSGEREARWDSMFYM